MPGALFRFAERPKPRVHSGAPEHDEETVHGDGADVLQEPPVPIARLRPTSLGARSRSRPRDQDGHNSLTCTRHFRIVQLLASACQTFGTGNETRFVHQEFRDEPATPALVPVYSQPSSTECR